MRGECDHMAEAGSRDHLGNYWKSPCEISEEVGQETDRGMVLICIEEAELIGLVISLDIDGARI